MPSAGAAQAQCRLGSAVGLQHRSPATSPARRHCRASRASDSGSTGQRLGAADPLSQPVARQTGRLRIWGSGVRISSGAPRLIVPSKIRKNLIINRFEACRWYSIGGIRRHEGNERRFEEPSRRVLRVRRCRSGWSKLPRRFWATANPDKSSSSVVSTPRTFARRTSALNQFSSSST
jgi:hypothetical protein